MSEIVFVEQSPEQGTRHVLRDGATIGREGCDVILSDPETSRRQARVSRERGAVVVEDLGSTNGTFVNDERITGPRTLAGGDEVRFGNTVWRVEIATAPRGDVPAPTVQPSVIRRVVQSPSAPAAFTPSGITRRKGSAATRMSATIGATVVVALTTFGVVLYYVTEPFK